MQVFLGKMLQRLEMPLSFYVVEAEEIPLFTSITKKQVFEKSKMRKLIFFLLILIYNTLPSQAQRFQSGRIIYRVQQIHEPDTSKVKGKGEYIETVKKFM